MTTNTRNTNEALEELYKIAVQDNGLALKFVKQQTEYICELAVEQNGLALEFVEQQTEYICELAVEQNGLALEFVEQQTHKICKLAIQQNWLALESVVKEDLEDLGELAHLVQILLALANMEEATTQQIVNQVEYSFRILENELKYLVHANIVEVLHSNVLYDTYTLTTLGKEKVKVFQDAQILYYELCKIAVEQNGLALEFVRI